MAKKLPANAGDARDEGSVPGLGSSPGEGSGNPLQFGFFFFFFKGKFALFQMLVSGEVGWQTSVQRPTAPQHTHTHTHSSLLLENSMDRGAWWATVNGVFKESDTTE